MKSPLEPFLAEVESAGLSEGLAHCRHDRGQRRATTRSVFTEGSAASGIRTPCSTPLRR